MAKTLVQITDEIIQAVVANFAPRLIDTRTGTVVKEAFVNPAAAQFKDSFDALDTIQVNQSVANAAAMEPAALDALVANQGVARFAGSAAVGFERFVKFVSPTANISIPAGTVVETAETNASTAKTFTTLSDAVLLPSSPPDPITGALAYVDVFVRADGIGELGNADAGTVTNLASVVTGIDQVYNPVAFASGKETQDNVTLASVAQSRAQGHLGTKPGYKDMVLSNFSVQDVLVVGNRDADITRNQFAGAVDIVILGDDIITSTDAVPYTGQPTIKPVVLPLVSVDSLTGIDGFAAPITFLGPAGGVGLGVDYDVILDTTGAFAGSFMENPTIVLHFVTAFPGAGTSLTVNYSNNQLPRTIQSFVSDEANNVLGSDVLVRAGIKINAAVTAQIKVIPGFDPVDTVTAAEAAVQAFFDGLLLGVDVQESDVITAIGAVAGVDFVDIPSFILALASAPATPLAEIVVNKQEFIRVSSISITAL